ncbi:unnamed protein product [Paramecium primaurelia]|uniref:Uncharacterized protein n=1 Tax=Paramecium primaurelia TaxID=5886 RepID=A0A8S1P1F6_PARPR|nr:unnamed protein product [Paramecium primaurelia]
MLLYINTLISWQKNCFIKKAEIISIIRGNYKSALNVNTGSLISSKNQNSFYGGMIGSCLRNEIYQFLGYTFCSLGYSITLDLIHNFELNTLKLWFRDEDYRVYSVKVFLINQDHEIQIYDGTAYSIITLTFPDQLVKGFRILNANGNTGNEWMHLIKVDAFYKLQTTQLQ